MPLSSRSFVELARNFGKLRGRATDVFPLRQTIQPTVDADVYSPVPWYGLHWTAVATPANYTLMFIEVPERVTLAPFRVFADTSGSRYKFARRPFVGAVPVLTPVPLLDDTPSLCNADQFISAIQVLPLVSPQVGPDFNQGSVVDFAIKGPCQLTFEGVVQNTAANLTAIWREVREVA